MSITRGLLEMENALPEGTQQPSSRLKRGRKPKAVVKKETVVVKEATPLMQHEVVEEEQHQNVIFKPNPGPQTTFLAAPEREVLYGGAAGGRGIGLSLATFCR